MAIMKCKMCGGDLAVIADITVAECEYCGSMQTLPKVNDERLAGFYDRANDLRMNHEFDKAIEIYEKIIEENPTDADAYWAMTLCRYGIEYVEENPGSIRKPTINRAQLVSVFEDVNYKSAIKYADAAQKKIYEEEAARIDRILQRYLEISRNEPPYDVFICYKETGLNGQRTEDSVRAGEIYRELTAEGFKVFFAPVTLENKLGEDYEPYIFAAIHSAKVMIVIGTKPEYMNAVWVKNEWSRFLTLAKNDSKKTLIPVYRDMDPYDMPEAFRFKQAQDMGKLGFMLDLVRGIEKLVGKHTSQSAAQSAPQAKAPAASGNIDTLLQRAQIFLEDCDWNSAGIYCEKVLDIAPTNGQAYMYKLLAEAKVITFGSLQSYHKPLESLRAYKNAVRYADEPTTASLIEWNQQIKDRLEREENERQEQERIRRERARALEEYRRDKNALTSAIDNTSSLIASQVREKENLEHQLGVSRSRMADISKFRRKLAICSGLLLVLAIIFLNLLANNGDGEIGFPLWFIMAIVATVLAHFRDKSKVAAFILAFVTVGIMPLCSSIKGLIEAIRTNAKTYVAEQNNLQSQLDAVLSELTVSRNALSELNTRKETLEAERRQEEND